MTFAIAAIGFACVVILGYFARLAPIGIDAAVAAATFGRATPIAWAFTRLGYARAVGALYVILAFLLAFETRRDLVVLAILACGQVASQFVATGLKSVFKRERPERWLKRLETTAGYPSGHATTAVVTYGGIALAVLAPIDAHVAFAVRDVVAGVTGLCACGIAWSRLALGAHYLSDVIGGIVLGIATIALLATLVPALHAS